MISGHSWRWIDNTAAETDWGREKWAERGGPWFLEKSSLEGGGGGFEQFEVWCGQCEYTEADRSADDGSMRKVQSGLFQGFGEVAW